MRRSALISAVILLWGAHAAPAWAGPPPPPTEANAGGAPPAAGPSPRTAPGARPGSAPGSAGGSTAGSDTSGDPSGDPVIDQRTMDEDHSQSWAYSSGGAVEPNYVAPAAERAKELKINPVGFYQGVSVAGENPPPFEPQELGTGGAVVTWTGFERGTNSSRVFVQMSSAVQPEESREGLTVRYRLPNTSVNVRNNQRALDTRWFRTPVLSVKVKDRGSETIVTLKLRREATPQMSVQRAANGFTMLVIEFADGASEATPPSADETQAPPES